jgi:hypothetical protein
MLGSSEVIEALHGNETMPTDPRELFAPDEGRIQVKDPA